MNSTLTIRTLLAGALLLTAASVSAQKMQLSYQEAIEMANNKNIDLRIQQNETERASTQTRQALYTMLPTAGINGDLFERRGIQTISNPETGNVEFRNAVSQNINLGFDARITLFGGFGRLNSFLAANDNRHAQELQLNRSRQNAVINASQQFMQVLLSYELYQIAIDNLRNQQETLKRLDGLTEVGARPLVEKYNQQAEVKRFESLMINAKNTYENDKSILAQTIQLEPGIEFEVVPEKMDIIEVLALQTDINDLYSIALQNRPDYQAQRQTVQSLGRQVYAQRGAFSPSVSAFYNYGTGYNSTLPFSTSEQLRSVFPAHFYGISFNIPLMNTLTTGTNVQIAKVNRENAKLTEDNIKSIIFRDVQTAQQNLEAAKASYYSSESQVSAANTAYDLQKERFDLGVGTFIEYSQAVNAQVQARVALAQATYSLIFQKIILDYQCGLNQ